jgi:16S rRNA G966 N2-methylase RsmD
MDYRSVISGLKGRKFDLVFLDPPYRMLDAYADAIDRLENAGALSEDVVIVAERKGNVQVSYPETFEVYDTRAYGETSIDFLHRRIEA